jgi:hypothetical protein
MKLLEQIMDDFDPTDEIARLYRQAFAEYGVSRRNPSRASRRPKPSWI